MFQCLFQRVGKWGTFKILNPKLDWASMQGSTLSLNLPVYWVEIFQNVTQNLLSQNYVNLLHLHHTQSSVQKTVTKVIKRRTSISFVDDVILYSLKNIRQKVRNMSLKSFFSFCFHLTRNCKRTINFLPLTRGFFPFSRSLWDHWISIPSFYSILVSILVSFSSSDKLCFLFWF